MTSVISTSTRVELGPAVPAAYKALIATYTAATQAGAAAGLSPRLLQLVKIRVSQLNGCAFCLDMHTRETLAAGEDAQRLAVLPAWRETRCFDDTERAALALAESITLVADGHVPDAVVEEVSAHLDAAGFATVAWMAVVMGAMNRVAITSRYPVPA